MKYDLKNRIKEEVKLMQIDINECNDSRDLYEALDYNGAVHEIIDSEIDIYYKDLRKWSVDNWQYIEQAQEEGLCEGITDFHKLIQSGQFCYYTEQAHEIIEEIFNEFNEEQE